MTLTIKDVEEILGLYRILPKPKHVIMTHESVIAKTDGHVVFLGLQPKWRKDVIVLTPQATPETVIHETLHTMGFGELGADILGKVLVVKYEITRNFPLLKRIISRKVEYTRCYGCQEFAELHNKYAGRAEHYVKK
ncbi:MAG TPA: hypothetical protein ENF41_04380 [Candidatus Bathyarchaeota archaeon]|nr:hypothetical protein [Candidatus Bathyarchaeota archaeon]